MSTGADSASFPDGEATLHHSIEFLNEIGIENRFTEDEFASFLPGVRIEQGVLVINRSQLLCPGDVLHEAGHLACLPPQKRAEANDNITESLGQEYSFEMAVILWTFAAATKLSIPLEQIFHSQAYKGESSWLIEQLETGNFIGLPLLQWLGLAPSDTDVQKGYEPFPAMLRWTRITD